MLSADFRGLKKSTLRFGQTFETDCVDRGMLEQPYARETMYVERPTTGFLGN